MEKEEGGSTYFFSLEGAQSPAESQRFVATFRPSSKSKPVLVTLQRIDGSQELEEIGLSGIRGLSVQEITVKTDCLVLTQVKRPASK